jgi:tRNA pseudouridine13 synthase
MDKQKLSTFEAVERIRSRYGLRPGAISFCGLKDKQGRTEQLIAVDGAEVDCQEPDLRLKPLGRTARPLSAANTTSNRFSVTVRAVTDEDLQELPRAAAEVNRLGVVNYFDSQRFGSLKHGQGYIAKDLLRGDFEAALRNYLAKPSPLDRSDDAKVKEFWRKHWGDWTRRVPFEAARRYDRVIRSLKEKPEDYLRAFLQIDAAYRALLLFTYQSWLWNEGVRRLLQLALPRTALFPLRYQAGTLLFHQDADAETLRWLRDLTFPLLGPDTPLAEPRVREAVEWVLGKEKLRLDQLRIPGAERLLFFKHEEREVLVQPSKLVLGRTQPDELNRGFGKLNVAFTLPPGSYATLVVKRLFHHTAREDSPAEIQASAGSGRPALGERSLDERSRRLRHGTDERTRRPRHDPGLERPDPRPGERVTSPRSSLDGVRRGRLRTPPPPTEPPEISPTRGRGFRASQRREKRRKPRRGSVRSCGRVPRLRDGAAPARAMPPNRHGRGQWPSEYGRMG